MSKVTIYSHPLCNNVSDFDNPNEHCAIIQQASQQSTSARDVNQMTSFSLIWHPPITECSSSSFITSLVHELVKEYEILNEKFRSRT